MSKKTQHSISLEEAIALTTRFREHRTPNLALCETFSKSSVLAMLAVDNSASLHIYLGQKENGEICSVLCAADADGQDLLPPAQTDESRDGDNDELILEDALRCPPLCPPPSPLNG